MTTPPMIKSYWRTLVDSLRKASGSQMLPEYDADHERNHNHRYYR